jgi:hypothetical protein
MMRIDKALNFILPIYGDEVAKLDGKGEPEHTAAGAPVMVQPVVAYVYSTPLPAEMIERHFLVLGQTFSAIFTRGLGVVAGPAMALRMLKKVAEDNQAWDGPAGARNVIDEMRRLTTVAVPMAGGGWEGVPLQVAVDRQFISAEDQKESENAIVFFICVSATLARAMREPMLTAAADLWSARVSPLSFTEFLTSLKTSTAPATTGVKDQPAAAPPTSQAPRTISATLGGIPAQLPH